MKISKSKQELARIISENGGWRDGAEWAIQHGTGRIAFTKSTKKPLWEKDNAGWGGSFFFGGFSFRKLQQHHQNALSRAEYFHLYPAPDADGWIEWRGDEGDGMPVDMDAVVDISYFDNIRHFGHTARNVNWSLVVAYRLRKPEQAEPEFCESVMRSIIEPEKIKELAEIMGCNEDIDAIISVAKINEDWIKSLTSRASSRTGSVEQLVADYRNAKDYAGRKQQEADAAKADADAKLKALELAGEALGLIVSPITAKQEPEMVITDWRDLKVGDEVEYLGGKSKEMIGEVMPVTFIDPDCTSGLHVHLGNNVWPSKWRFIRRP